jgi:limonene-1,2-epoxide hydrolase
MIFTLFCGGIMHSNVELLTRFYEAFARLDAAAMVQCYHPEATFTDEAFVNLNRDQTVAMWTMLCSRAKNFSLTFSDVQADDALGKAHWEAIYLFSATGRSAHNIVDAEFDFKEGKIWKHRDHFDFYRRSRQALGSMGTLLGWTGFLQSKIQTEAMKGLHAFMAKVQA